MTEVSFYSHAPGKLTVARQLVAKALEQKLNVLIYVSDPAIADELDRMLWTHPPLSFIPHCRDANPLAPLTPVLIGTQADALSSADIIINLSDELPPIFGRFTRLMEIVTDEEPDLGLARERYRHYKNCGYALVNHNLQNRKAKP